MSGTSPRTGPPDPRASTPPYITLTTSTPKKTAPTHATDYGSLQQSYPPPSILRTATKSLPPLLVDERANQGQTAAHEPNSDHFAVTVRTSPNRLSKSSSSTFAGPGAPPMSKPGPRLALYRSNSSLDLLDRENYLLRSGGPKLSQPTHQQISRSVQHRPEHSYTPGCFTRRKDFGSQGSIDLLSNSATKMNPMTQIRTERSGSVGTALTGQFLSMMAANSRRSSLDVHDELPATANLKKTETSSPRLRLKFQKLFESANKGGSSEVKHKDKESASAYSKPEPSLFRKLRGPVKEDAISEVDMGKPVLRHGPLPGHISEERIRRRAFAHYDCQSVSANISYAAKLRGLLSKRRNTTTGASAASLGQRQSATPPSVSLNNIAGAGLLAGAEGQVNPSSLDLNSQPDADLGDGHSNALVQSCPYFRNEVGGEEERIISLSKFKKVSNYSELGRPGFNPEESFHRAHQARGLSILEWNGGKTHWTQGTCPYKGSSASTLEAVDLGAEYYRNYFYKQEHENWFGSDEVLGPLAISIKRERIEGEKKDGNARYMYRLIVRSTELNTLRGSILEENVPGIKPNSKGGTHAKEVIEFLLPEVQLSCLRQGIPGPATEEQLLKVDQQILTHRHKVGVMYCRNGQSTEEEMYNNEEAGPAFNEFLDLIGQRVRLKGFEKYTGGLDKKDDSTGLFSICSEYQDCEVIFHVSTLLPFTPNNRQQLMRKRHIGNDIVTIVFQEPGALPFSPKNIRSQFQHVFIIVRVLNPCSDNTYYSVSVSRSKEVPLFGPPIPEGAQFPKGKAFVDFLIAKAINAENATYRSEKFTTMATRTRQEYLKDLVASYSTHTTIDPRPKFSLNFSNKKKDLTKPRFNPDHCLGGALSWSVWLDDTWMDSKVDVYLALSTDTLVLIDTATREPVFAIPTSSILGWNSFTANSLRIYYHQGECVTIHSKEAGIGFPSGETDDISEITSRLRSVTNGAEAEEFILKRNEIGQLGFHVQQDGAVTEVETCGCASQAGLQQGSRLVEICKVAVATLNQDQMIDFLKTSDDVVVLVIPPNPDGTPRRGCDASHCIYSSPDSDGEYENTYSGGGGPKEPGSLCQSHHFKSPLPSKLLQQAVPGNHRKRYEPRSFSPPRSSNSSGYGTGSSSKSFSSASDPNFLPHQEGETLTSGSSGISLSDERWYDLSSETPTVNGNDNSPPPIPARNVHNKLGNVPNNYSPSKGRHSVPNTTTANLNVNGTSVLIMNHNNNVYKANGETNGHGIHDKSFTAKRDFFQRNNAHHGSFHTRLSPSRSHDLLHLKSPNLRPFQRVISAVGGGHQDDYMLMASPVNPAVFVPTATPEKVTNGAVYQLASSVVAPLVETTIKGKVTYLTDFPLTQGNSLEHLPRIDSITATAEQKDVETLKNERLAALKSAYLEKHRVERPENESPKSSRFSAPACSLNGDIGSSSDELSSATKPRASSMSGRTPSSGSPKSHISTAEVKLRPSSSTSRGSTNGNRNSTLQEDLMRLINPDYIPPKESDVISTAHSVSANSSRPASSNGSLSIHSSLKSSRIGSDVSQTPRGPVTRASDPVLPLMPESSDVDWSTLVDTATRAFQTCDIHLEDDYKPTKLGQGQGSMRPQQLHGSVSLNSSPTRGGSRSSSNSNSNSLHSPHLSWREDKPEYRSMFERTSNSRSPTPLGDVLNLEARVSQLEAELKKEQQSKTVLASKVENLQLENQRLLRESHTTLDHVNKFKEWLLSAVDHQNHVLPTPSTP